MDKNKKKRIIILLIIFCLFSGGVCAAFLGYKVYQHEKNQSATITELNNRVSSLSAKMSILENTVEGEHIEWDDEGFNYLAIGNSITIHGLATYWWDDDRGMASSSDNKDYVHLVEQYLERVNGSVTMHATNFSAWETQGADRAEFLELLDPYLSDELDLITIQLGENASNLDSWEKDFEELICYVSSIASQATIIVVGDFWSNGSRDELKKCAAENTGVIYVSLDGIRDNSEYYAGRGTIVEDSEGNDHIIEHNGVANHPGDKGMAAIAERIIAVLQ